MKIRRISKFLIYFAFGGVAYCVIELFWRGRTHSSMFFAGGIIFVLFSKLNVFLEKTKTLYKCIIGSSVITFFELIFGVIFNLILHQNVWDYSHLKFNLLGQICLLYSVIWGFLSVAVFKVNGLFGKIFN